MERNDLATSADDRQGQPRRVGIFLFDMVEEIDATHDLVGVLDVGWPTGKRLRAQGSDGLTVMSSSEVAPSTSSVALVRSA